MVVALFIAIKELRQLQRNMTDVHKKVCCDDDKHLGG
jgi:hypothetical protein